ncbi:MAG: 23S rRNA (pseudouridine(1915)-N(3))-methyltransferase RlmH [Candidatus Cloacimonetes bacterium]|nr:23S rRNA (pseudouridine(1915)-N(3))-methyltransferase RlmH [Candidatus Cloacimonadota bacterium]MBS3766589.1 23S rRNA (pseudouridine(1915)-N(3))-methyltransferase RlmH [Candidatus Cloacimonadota bacterium]
MKFFILAVGKNSKGPLKKLEKEYIKRISKYLNIEVEEIPPVKKSGNASFENIINLEAKKIWGRLPDDTYRISLDEKGKLYTTEIFAKFIKKLLIHKRKPIYFIIGGPYGLGKKVRDKSHRTISLSPLTFTHEMTRVILLEQLYRAMTIIKGKKYHY